MIETGRWQKPISIPIDERKCIICPTLEDEFHFVCICQCYTTIRNKYINKYFYKNPSVYKFIELLKSNNKNDLVRLSLFVKEALCIRKAILNV